MSRDVAEVLRGRYAVPGRAGLRELQRYWDELLAQGDEVPDDMLGPSEIAVVYRAPDGGDVPTASGGPR